MKYQNAAEVLPMHLLLEIQKYVNGGLIYIPRNETRKKWGENTGTKSYFEMRNRTINQKFSDGYTVLKLSEEYGLSFETIRKIIYQR